MQPAVLVVDDNDLVLKVVTQFLSTKGMYVMTTAKPSLGKELADSVENLVAIVLDIDMPEIDGVELSEVLRSHPKHAAVPIIFYSGLRQVRTDALVGKVLHASVVSKTNGVEALWTEIQRVARQPDEFTEQASSATSANPPEGADELELDQIFDGLLDAPARATVRPTNPAVDVVIDDVDIAELESVDEAEDLDDVYSRATVRPPSDGDE